MASVRAHAEQPVMASAPKVVYQPEDQAEGHTEENARGERKIECAVIAAVDDVSGHAAKTEGKLGAEED